MDNTTEGVLLRIEELLKKGIDLLDRLIEQNLQYKLDQVTERSYKDQQDLSKNRSLSNEQENIIFDLKQRNLALSKELKACSKLKEQRKELEEENAALKLRITKNDQEKKELFFPTKETYRKLCEKHEDLQAQYGTLADEDEKIISDLKQRNSALSNELETCAK